MSVYVGNVCRSGFYQIRQLRIIRRNLTFKTAATLVHAFVISRIDYCNDVLSGITKQQLDRVQKLLNTAARLLLRIPKFNHISAAIRDTLHWLPVSHRVLFKICILVWNSITRAGPSYIQELCVLSSVNSVRDLRSSDRLILKVPRCRTATLQKRGFSVVGPVSWNGLPLELRLLFNDSATATFKNKLKTFYFQNDLENSLNCPEERYWELYFCRDAIQKFITYLLYLHSCSNSWLPTWFLQLSWLAHPF